MAPERKRAGVVGLWILLIVLASLVRRELMDGLAPYLERAKATGEDTMLPRALVERSRERSSSRPIAGLLTGMAARSILPT